MTRPLLFTPLTLRGVTLPNRVVVSPMCQYVAVDGQVQDWHYAHHARFALGGVGLAFVEATGVTRDGRITHGCTGLWEDAQIPGLRRITELYRAHGVVPGIQIGHAGRKASTQRPWEGNAPLGPKDADPPWTTVAPSALPVGEGWHVPHALSRAEILEIVEAFRAAARRALEAGFDVIEIHGAHGYLIHSFVSPISNRRNDEFGGDAEGRMRVPVMIAEAIRSVWPAEKPLFYRASVIDDVEGGLTEADTIALALKLKAAGVDVIDCSARGVLGAVTLSKTFRPSLGYQVPLAEAVRRGAGIATMAVGLIVEPRQAEAVLTDGKADLIAMGRELLADPNWVYRAARELALPNPHAVLPPAYAFFLERRPVVPGAR
jgi:2,4-dienoyl-CoA reductase-like NADH-dependent reductase (Old Yellow Enzyme family)